MANDGKLSSGLSLGHVMVRSHLGSRWNFTVFPFAPILRQGAADDAGALAEQIDQNKHNKHRDSLEIITDSPKQGNTWTEI